MCEENGIRFKGLFKKVAVEIGTVIRVELLISDDCDFTINASISVDDDVEDEDFSDRVSMRLVDAIDELNDMYGKNKLVVAIKKLREHPSTAGEDE